MKFAHFSHVWGKHGMTPAQRYEQLWRELELCDELGFDYCFAVEHHFNPNESWMSSGNLYSVGVAQRTKRIRMGAMGHVVPIHQPMRLVEEIAVADQMSGGRVEVGLVPGVNARPFPQFGGDFATSESRFTSSCPCSARPMRAMTASRSKADSTAPTK
jgi:alkanesulfonate monooxygenase SsuD/methylene tetrahydromethanopterin reductase-like flavin-dependent oxidoreductase (luciferase family)